MGLAEAREAERQERVEEAASLYEAALGVGPKPLGVLLDLAVLYWQATDFGYLSQRKLPHDFVARAGRRFIEVLSEAAQVYPDSGEVAFWQRYISWVDLGEPFPIEACATLLERDPATLIPVMVLFGTARGEDYAQEAAELLRRCQAEGTTRGRYVTSVLEGIQKRRAHARS